MLLYSCLLRLLAGVIALVASVSQYVNCGYLHMGLCTVQISILRTIVPCAWSFYICLVVDYSWTLHYTFYSFFCTFTSLFILIKCSQYCTGGGGFFFCVSDVTVCVCLDAWMLYYYLSDVLCQFRFCYNYKMHEICRVAITEMAWYFIKWYLIFNMIIQWYVVMSCMTGY